MKFNEPIYRVLNSAQKLKLLMFLLGRTHIPDVSERELAKFAHISHASVNRAMADFDSIGLVSFKFTGGSHIWRVRKESYAYLTLKKIIDAMRENMTPYDNLLETLKKGLKNTPASTAVLFGSVSRKQEKENSDIDLFVLVANEKEKKETEEVLDKLLIKCLELYGNTLSSYVLTLKEYSDKSRAKLLAEIKKGIKIL